MINNIMNILNEIEYGFKDDFGNNIINDLNKWNNEFNDFYYLQDPEELLNSKCGVCWDQVELERYLFDKEGIVTKTYFIYIDGENYLPSHTFLTYEKNNKCYWFEHSWDKYKGIHKYSNIDVLLNDVKKKFKKEYNIDADLYLYEYSKPKKHIRCNDFYKYIETEKRIDN